ncbi:hypothetical protein B0E53_07104 [Micromonospora sp. MH33]|nr:hypothetical protein B0E53_07104 [Micromonospora sp. MH33]
MNARPSGVVGTRDRPTSGLTSTSRAALARTAAASSAMVAVSSAGWWAGSSSTVTQPPRSSTSSVSFGPAAAITSASRPGSAAVSSVVQLPGRRARCAARRVAHSVSSGSPAGAVATYRTVGASATTDSANSDLPERIPPSTRRVFHPSTDMPVP